MGDAENGAADRGDRAPHALVVGTGKMARNIGRFLAARGVRLSFASRSVARLGEIEGWARKRMRRAFDLAGGRAAPQFVDRTAPASTSAIAELATVTIAIEATREDPATKTGVFAWLEPLLAPDALRCSSSSSIWPSEIHPTCLGLHFFYPVELSGFVELVHPTPPAPQRQATARAWCEALGLRVVEQSEPSAFVANRLLLPLQAECARAVARGADRAALDAATASDLLPVGQLALMDAVGLDVLAAAVARYLGRMAPERAEALRPLAALLALLVAEGRLGEKSGGGLVTGAPWPPEQASRVAALAGEPDATVPEPGAYRALFVNGCLAALAAGEVDRDGLAAILDGIYGGAERFDRVLTTEGPAMRQLLEGLFARTGRWYWSPAPGLGGPRP